MHLILAPFGSSGDVNPFVGIGVGMRARGHRVTVVANEHYAPLVESEGLDFVAAAADEEYRRLLGDPDLWHPKKSMEVLYGAILDVARRTCERIADLQEAGPTALAAPSFNIGARVAHDALGIPLASVVLNPILIRSVHSPVRSPLLQYPRWMGRWGVKLAYRMIDRKYDQVIGARLNELRRSLDLPAVRGVNAWMRSPERIVCLWPEWLYEPQADWPPQARTTGFVHYDGASASSNDGDAAWTSALDQAPIVFTAGTAMAQGQDFFAAAAEACALVGRPGLLLTQHAEQLPDRLPEGVQHVSYAPFGELLPRAAAIVHHGGIGTAARALKAGIPQLIVPHAYDQYDNAQRLVDLGVAAEVPRDELGARTLAEALDRLLSSTIMADRVRRFSARVQADDALGMACGLLEEMAGVDAGV